MGHTVLRDIHRCTAARVAAHARRTLSDRETAKAPDLDTVSAHQCVAHGLKNGCDCKISITRCQLTEPRKEKFDEVRSVHAQRNYLTVFSRCIFLQTCAASSEYAIPFFWVSYGFFCRRTRSDAYNVCQQVDGNQVPNVFEGQCRPVSIVANPEENTPQA